MGRRFSFGTAVRRFDPHGLAVAPVLVVDPILDPATRVAYFLQAAARDRMAVVDGWLKLGIDVRVREDAALMGAAQAGHMAMVLRLIDAGADPWARDGQALVLAARGGHLGLVEGLLDRMGQVNVLAMRSWPTSGVSPEMGQDRWQRVLRASLGDAVSQAHRPVVDRLIQAGADVRALPAVVQVMGMMVERQKLIHRAASYYGTSVRARMKARMDAPSFQRHTDLVTWLLHPTRYGLDEDGQLLVLAVQANNMTWVERLLRLVPEQGVQLFRLEAALTVAEQRSSSPMLDALRPLMIQAQRRALIEVADVAQQEGLAVREDGGTSGPEEPGSTGTASECARATPGGRRRL